jgi:transcription antitermination factor NusG
MKATSSNQSQDITSTAVTLLDSQIALVSALGANREPRCDEEILTASSDEKAEWFFLLLRGKDIKRFNDLLSGSKLLTVKEDKIIKKYRCQFKTFIYTTVDHRRRIENCLYSEKEYQKRMESAALAMKKMEEKTSNNIPGDMNAEIIGGGYLFVHAPIKKLTKALELIVPHRFLVMDLGTREAARIPDKQMKNFVFLYETVPWNIQFMERPISDYAKNHERVRITGGKLKGAEGYIVRIHRDRSMVFSFGNMTLAVGGIHSYPFETVL